MHMNKYVGYCCATGLTLSEAEDVERMRSEAE